MKIRVTATVTYEFEIGDDDLVSAYGSADPAVVVAVEEALLSESGDYFIGMLGSTPHEANFVVSTGA